MVCQWYTSGLLNVMSAMWYCNKPIMIIVQPNQKCSLVCMMFY